MNPITSKALGFVAAVLTLASPAAWAFPDKAITLIVPYPPGGATDVIGRILARGLGERLKATVVVENKAGAGTAIGAAALQQAAPDGHTLFFSSNTTYTINPAIKATLPYDSQRFEAIGLIGTLPLALVAHPSFPAKSIAEFVAQAKAKPGALSYASFGAGTSSHFGGEMIKFAVGLDMVHVPYKGSAPAMQDLIGGQVKLSVDTVLAARPQAANGAVKVLATMGSKRSAVLPDVPTFAESGYPALVLEPWGAVVAPPGLAAPARKLLVQALAAVIADPIYRAEIEKAGFEVAYEPPSAYAARLAKELPALRALVARAKITAQ